VSKTTNRHCAGTVQSQGGRVGSVQQVGFEPRPEDSYGGCGSDKIRETVPDASSGNWPFSVNLYACFILIVQHMEYYLLRSVRWQFHEGMLKNTLQKVWKRSTDGIRNSGNTSTQKVCLGRLYPLHI